MPKTPTPMTTPSGMRPHPDSLYYYVATEALKDAKAVTGTNNDAEFDRSRFVVTAMVFSALCLEAFINECYDAYLPDLSEEIERTSLETKWLMLPLLMGAANTFKKVEQPYQTFRELVKTRNERLVHFKPGKEALGGSGKGPPIYLGDLVGDIVLAERYVQCVKAMIEKLNLITGGKTSLPGYLKGEKYMSSVWSSSIVPIESL